MAITKDELIKTAIIEAAQKLFQQFGLAKTTMEDIAKAVGKGKSSLYYYYATKEDIFEAVVDKEKQNIEKDILAAIDKEDSAGQKFRAFAQTKYKALRKRQLLYKIMTEGFAENMCVFNIIKQRYSQSEREIVRDILTYGIEQGEFDPAYAEQLDATTHICCNTFKGLQMELSFGGYKGSAADLVDATVDFVARGLNKD